MSVVGSKLLFNSSFTNTCFLLQLYMKLYKNQTKDNAKQNGFLSNFEFAKMSSTYTDRMVVVKEGVTLFKEDVTYFPDTDTCEVKVYTAKKRNDGTYDFI